MAARSESGCKMLRQTHKSSERVGKKHSAQREEDIDSQVKDREQQI